MGHEEQFDHARGPQALPETPPDPQFEAALRRSLTRVDAPASLAVFLANAAEAEARAAHAEARSTGTPATTSAWTRFRSAISSPRLAAPWFAGTFAAVMLLIVAVVSIGVQQQHKREQATRDFALSQQIEQQALDHTRAQLERAGVDLGQ